MGLHQRNVSCLMWVNESLSVASDSLWPHGLHRPWNSPGQNTRVGSCSLLQGIFPTQESNPGLLHCGQILYQLSYHGSPRILEWVAYPFSTGSSQPRNWTRISCIAGTFFTKWAVSQSRQFIMEYYLANQNSLAVYLFICEDIHKILVI